MDYPLEQLGPDRFQEFCQSLLARMFPDIQCFPVGQKDGGRDALAYYSSRVDGGKFSVFQVKFKSGAQADPKTRTRLVAEVREELPAIMRLIPAGAAKYFLLTNVRGSSAPGSGTIDSVNSLLRNSLSIDSVVLWRDDINRRLDDAWDLKWAYPELITGSDFLRVLIESGVHEGHARRHSALRSFLTFQYHADGDVRFKQVELKNRLTALFVDVPAHIHFDQSERDLAVEFAVLSSSLTSGPESGKAGESEADTDLVENLGEFGWASAPEPGAAALLLSSDGQRLFPLVVLEGAPGQGKSTVTQFVCQVHRAHLLGTDGGDDGEALREHSRGGPSRLPIRVDLRDFAVWLDGKDPFAGGRDGTAPGSWHRSLESFLAWLVRCGSGGASFSVDDVLAVFRISSVLLVFDGLDEVADLGRRRDVVDELVSGISRLKAASASLQAVVTSRPAAFVNSPGLPNNQFRYIQLGSLSRGSILEYSEKWIFARGLSGADAESVRSVLREKLGHPHIRDLARNPMQLAILLSLVHSVGVSLPEKRTALYQAYIERFLNREAEKSEIVKSHRELIIDIHRHIAWVLHSKSELGDSRASVPQPELQRMIASYLEQEGHPAELATRLFEGVVERVVALVSRIQGTFEFEVQPLREFFAACHLYFTAPASPVGGECSGSKPDRFDAIARNLYWLNVTRFYAGCYSKGELASLAERLEVLCEEEGYRFLAYPRALAATLLSDLVFSQSPPAVQRVVGLLSGANGLRLALLGSAHLPSGPATRGRLPNQNGRGEFVDDCFKQLASRQPRDLEGEILVSLRAYYNDGSEPVYSRWWSETLAAAELDLPDWLSWGAFIGTLGAVPIHELSSLFPDPDATLTKKALAPIFRAGRSDFCHSDKRLFDEAVRQILDGQIRSSSREVLSPLDALSESLDVNRFAFSFRAPKTEPLAVILEASGWGGPLIPETKGDGWGKFPEAERCEELASSVMVESQRPCADWSTTIAPWESIVEAARRLWGERWSFCLLANVGAAAQLKEGRPVDVDLDDRDAGLTCRAAAAKLRSGSFRWWRRQLERAEGSPDKLFVLLVYLTWGTWRAITKNLDAVETSIAALPDGEWMKLSRALSLSLARVRTTVSRTVDVDGGSISKISNPRLAWLLYRRLPEVDRDRFIAHTVLPPGSTDPQALELSLDGALDLGRFGSTEWKPRLAEISRCYRAGTWPLFPVRMTPRYFHSGPGWMPLEVARRILAGADSFPRQLVSLADRRLTLEIARSAPAVAKIAENEKWFSE